MKLINQIKEAQEKYPEEYKIAKQLSYPDAYFLIGCKWLHDWRGYDDCKISETATKYFLLQWEKYVKDAVAIDNIKDINELAWTVFKYRKMTEERQFCN